MSLYWFPLPLDFLLCKILGLHTCKVLRERPTTPHIVSSLVQTQGPVSPYSVMCESTDRDQYLLKEGLGSGPVKGPLLPGGGSCYCGGSCYRAALPGRIRISRIPSVSQTTYWVLETPVEPPVIWKENTLWTVFPTIDCLLRYSDWFWSSSFQHSNEFFSLSSWHQVKSCSVVSGNCYPTLQIRW